MISAIEVFYTAIERCLGGGTPPGRLARDEAGRTVQVVLSVFVPDSLGRSMNDLVAEVASKLAIDEQSAVRRICCVMDSLRVLVEVAGSPDEQLAG